MGIGTCVSAGAQTHVCMYMHKPELSCFLRCCLSLNLSHTDLVRLPRSELSEIPLSPSPGARMTRHVTLSSGLYMGSGDLNSRPHACASNTSPRALSAASSLAFHRTSLPCSLHGFDEWATPSIDGQNETGQNQRTFAHYTLSPFHLLVSPCSRPPNIWKLLIFLNFFIILPLLERSIIGITWLESRSIFRLASFV